MNSTLVHPDSFPYRLSGRRRMVLSVVLVDELLDGIHQFRILGSHAHAPHFYLSATLRFG